MAVGARTAGRAGPQASLADAAAIAWMARLLLVAVTLDLIVTRFLVRLAIFIPKGEPLATLSAAVGRLGAATDAAVPLVGLLLLGSLLVRVGRIGRRREALTLVALAVVAAGGLALIHFPPRPAIMLLLDSLVVAIAVETALRVRDAPGPVVARVGFVALAAAIAFAAIGRAVDLYGVSAGRAARSPWRSSESGNSASRAGRRWSGSAASSTSGSLTWTVAGSLPSGWRQPWFSSSLTYRRRRPPELS